MARSDFVNHNWRVTVAGGIPVTVKKIKDGGVVATVRELLRGGLLGRGTTVYVRCELPGLVSNRLCSLDRLEHVDPCRVEIVRHRVSGMPTAVLEPTL